MTNLAWTKCHPNSWCNLLHVDLSNVDVLGVYIIWHGGQRPRVVRVGQGDIAERLRAHRRDQEILQYAQYGGLFVTWAEVSLFEMDGVERYLADQWTPLVGDAFPTAAPIAVNSPWS